LDDDTGYRGRIGSEQCVQALHVRQRSRIQTDLKLVGEFCFASAIMRKRQQFDHQLASLFLRHALDQALEGLPVCLPREELIAINQTHQRHGFASQRMNDMPIVDDLTMFATWR